MSHQVVEERKNFISKVKSSVSDSKKATMRKSRARKQSLAEMLQVSNNAVAAQRRQTPATEKRLSRHEIALVLDRREQYRKLKSRMQEGLQATIGGGSIMSKGMPNSESGQLVLKNPT